jgi:hypothetical protein
LESFDAGKDATSELILGQVAEESFDHVEPTAAGGREVKMKALVARRPALNRRLFVGGIVVDDKVELFVGGRLAIDETQELQPFLMAMTLHASGHHSAVKGVQSGKQRGSSMPACNRAASYGRGPVSSASRAGYGQGLGSGSSPPMTARAHARADSDTGRRCPLVSRRNGDPCRCGFRP